MNPNQTVTAFLKGRPSEWFQALEARYCIAVAITTSDAEGKTVRVPTTGSPTMVWDKDGIPVPGVAIDVLMWTRFVDAATGRAYIPLGGTWHETSSITGTGLVQTMGPDDIRKDIKDTMRIDRLRLVATGVGSLKAFVPESNQRMPMPKWSTLLGLEKNLDAGWTAGDSDILPRVSFAADEEASSSEEATAIPMVTNRREAQDALGEDELRIRQAPHIPNKELWLDWAPYKLTQKTRDNPGKPVVFEVADPAVLDGLFKARSRDVLTSILEGGNGAPLSTYVDSAFGGEE